MASVISRWLSALAFIVLSGLIARGQTGATGIQVEANPQNPWSLRVTVQSHAQTRVTLSKFRLPWENRYSMILVAVTASGRYIDRIFPEDDPSPERISVEPGQLLTGDVNLHDFFRGLDGALKETDIQLFWAYQAPEELGIPRWSGGWILIPQSKGQKQAPTNTKKQ